MKYTKLVNLITFSILLIPSLYAQELAQHFTPQEITKAMNVAAPIQAIELMRCWTLPMS